MSRDTDKRADFLLPDWVLKGLAKDRAAASGEGIDEIQRIIWLIDEGGAHPKLTEAIDGLKRLRAQLGEERVKHEGKTGELCMDCGNRYPEVYTVPDEMWRKVSGRDDESGLLCPACFDKRARDLGLVPFWACADRQYPAPDATALREALEKIAKANRAPHSYMTAYAEVVEEARAALLRSEPRGEEPR